MTKKKIQELKIIKGALRKMVGERCWYVSCGCNVGSSFQLCLGDMVRRKIPLNNKAHPLIFRQNDPTYSLLVWCDWRLSRNQEIVVTSDDCDNNFKWCNYLRKLRGSRINLFKITSRFHDFTVNFNTGWQLDIFCNRGIKEPSIDTNWELFIRGRPVVGV